MLYQGSTLLIKFFLPDGQRVKLLKFDYKLFQKDSFMRAHLRLSLVNFLIKDLGDADKYNLSLFLPFT
jgi:hypothetical protein